MATERELIAIDIDKLPLRYKTDLKWVELVAADFALFVADHASNERKASATAMDFVVRYPDRLSLVSTASKIAQEELFHFRKVFSKMRKCGFSLQPDQKDPYIVAFRQHVRPQGDDRLLDRLLLFSIIETRAIERFRLLADHLPDSDWRAFYLQLMKSELSHGTAFVDEARKLFDFDTVSHRYDELLSAEADICRETPISWRFHG